MGSSRVNSENPEGTARPEIRKVLILDQDTASARALAESLEQAGLQVLLSPNADEIPTVAVHNRPDVVLLDASSDGNSIRLREQLREMECTRNIPVLLLVDGVNEERVHSLLGGEFDYIVKPFESFKVIPFLKSHLQDLPHDTDVNHLSHLPGPVWLERELRARLGQAKPFALVNIGIDVLLPFRYAYGSLRAELAIRLLSRILKEGIALFGNTDDLLGHVGEDSFYIVTSPSRVRGLCLRVISSFDDRVRKLYRQPDALKGYVECEYPPGFTIRHPIMRLSIGVTTSENHGATDPLVMKRIASEARGYAKAMPTSAFYVDQRRDDLILEGRLGCAGRRGKGATSGRVTMEGSREKVDFANFVTNQLRVPVTIVHSTLDYLIQTGQTNLTEEQRRYLDVLQKHARHLSDMISQLATFYRVCQGDLQMHLDTGAMARVMEQVTGLMREIARDKNIHFNTRGTESIGRVVVDEERLCQALSYTLASVAEYVPQGASIEIILEELEAHVRVTIASTNFYLSGTELARAFRSFYHPDRVTTPNYGNLGLGFYLARQLLNRIGGRMVVRQGDHVSIVLEFPKAWQSTEGRARLIQQELVAARTLARMELGRLEAMSADDDMESQDLSTIRSCIGSLIDQMEVQATKAVFLLDETLGRLSGERERVAALDAGFLTFLETLCEMIEHRDRHFAGHSKRVAAEAFAIGQEVKLAEGELQTLYYAALLHDVGMVGVPDRILALKDELSSDEWASVRQHPVIGSRAIAAGTALGLLAQPVLHHHERYDGTGYPLGLKAEKIPLAARIVAVADAYDAMISDRAYRPAMPVTVAIERVALGARTQFDARIVAAFLKLHGGNSEGVNPN